MSCVLKVGGAELDVHGLSEVLLAAPYRGKEKWSPISPLDRRNSDGWSVHLDVSNAVEFDRQIEDAVRFLTENESSLREARVFPGVQFAELDFLIKTRDVAVQTDTLPPRLLKLAGALDIALSVSRYERAG